MVGDVLLAEMLIDRLLVGMVGTGTDMYSESGVVMVVAAGVLSYVADVRACVWTELGMDIDGMIAMPGGVMAGVLIGLLAGTIAGIATDVGVDV